MRECQECRRWTDYIEHHHKVPKGWDKRGWDFPGNLIDLCNDCHHGLAGPHLCRETALRYFYEVRDYLEKTLTETHYTPEALAKAIKLPLKQAYQVVKLLRPETQGYRREDIIFRLLGNRYAQREAVS